MGKKIDKLTSAQEMRLVEFRDEWLKIGLCCEPADFETGDRIIRGFYRRINKPEPIILHFSSPAVCELAVNFVFAILREPQTLYSQLDSQLYSQLRSQLGSQLYSQLYSQLDSQLGSQLYSQLDSQLDSQLYSQLDSQLYSQLGQLKSYFSSNRWGAGHWCAWEAFYLFGHEIGVKYKAEDIAILLEWAAISKSIGWWAPWDGICFVSDRPREVHFDDQRRLHCEHGMAARYSDGWGCYSWHGTAIPGEWITDRTSLTVKDAITWQNGEQRRAATEIIGWAAILRDPSLRARIIDEDGDPQIGSLIEGDLPDLPRPARFCRVQCGTGREFVIPVPPEITTALQAQAWMQNIAPHEFTRPEIRT